jgi:hypothetical protein
MLRRTLQTGRQRNTSTVCQSAEGSWPTTHRGAHGSILGQFLWYLWWSNWHRNGFSSEHPASPRQYHPTKCPHSPCSYSHQDRRVKPGNLPMKLLLFRISGSMKKKKKAHLVSFQMFKTKPFLHDRVNAGWRFPVKQTHSCNCQQ